MTSLKNCPACNKQYTSEANYCPVDGTPLTEKDPKGNIVLPGQIELLEPCGNGSMGTVYKAWQRTMDRHVAVKILRRNLVHDPKVVKRFHREAKAAARLSHPNIITVHFLGDTEDGLPFMVMEYVQGKRLDEICANEGALPANRVAHIGQQCASALAEAHSQKVIHRDLKPENIILTQKKTDPDFVTVLDFGIAKILRTGNESQITQTGAIFGTPHFISPEQASGDEVDHRCDLYSLGVILYRMATGKLLFDGASGMEVLVKHIKQIPPSPRQLIPSIPEPLEKIIQKCLEKKPKDRWQTAEEICEALKTIRAEPWPSPSNQVEQGAKISLPPTVIPATIPGLLKQSIVKADISKLQNSEILNQSDPKFHIPSDTELGIKLCSPTQTTEIQNDTSLMGAILWPKKNILGRLILWLCIGIATTAVGLWLY